MATKQIHPVRRLREKRGWSQLKLAIAVGVTPETISNIERWRRGGSTNTRLRIAKVLGCSINEVTDPREAD